MATILDATIEKVLDQAFAKSHQIGIHAADRLSASNDNISTQTNFLFLEEKVKVGTREAAAMQRMDKDQVSEAILNARAVSNQPQPPIIVKPA